MLLNYRVMILPNLGILVQVIDRWRTPQFDGSLQWYNPASYKDMLTGNILRGTVRPEVANTPELPGPVKWAVLDKMPVRLSMLQQ